MPAPSSVEFSTGLRTTAQNAVLTDIDAGSGAGKMKLYADDDTLLATITLADPAGAVTTGTLTLTAGQTATVATGGTCTYGTITDSDDNVVVTIPAAASGAAVAGQISLSDVVLIALTDVELISCVIG